MTASSVLQDLSALGVVARVEGGHLALMPASRVPPELLEAIRANKAALLELLTTPRPAQTPTSAAMLEPLPLELRALLRAASSGVLPKGAVSLRTGLTLDLERYVLGFAAQYLTGDQLHALRELHECQAAWQVLTRKVVNA